MSGIFPKSNRRQANQTRQVFQINKITPPNCVWTDHKDFDLSKIPKIFEPSDYQRVLNKRHTYKIVESIVNNQFYDNTIRVVKNKDNKYHVIDGQHRLAALWILHDQYGVKTYDLAIQIFNADEQRQVYRKINAGKGLTQSDILKTYDTGDVEFFNELRDYCTHNKTIRKPSFLGLLQAIHRSRGFKHIPSTNMFETMLKEIQPDELNHCTRIARGSQSAYRLMQSGKIFQSTLYRMVYLIGKENNFDVNQYHRTFLVLLGNEEFDTKSGQSFLMLWDELHTLALKLLKKENVL